MKIIREALAGTLESGDVKVKIMPSIGSPEIIISSDVMKQFGHQIKAVAEQTLQNMGVTDGVIILDDKGALDCVIRARIQCAVLRAAEVAAPQWEKMS